MKLAAQEATYRDRWLLLARESFTPSKRQACKVCRRYKSLTHAHHILPLSYQFARGFETPDHAIVWLCPTHHAAVHLFISQCLSSRDKAGAGIIEMITELKGRELSKVFAIFEAFRKQTGAAQ